MASFRLIDVSTSRLSADPDEERRQIADILLPSLRNNEDVQVTGTLLATGHSFAQVLEGERADVEETYARIQRGPRHTDLVPILTDCIETRQFPEWSMAFIGRSSRPGRPRPVSLSDTGDATRRAGPGAPSALCAGCCKPQLRRPSRGDSARGPTSLPATH